MKLLNLEKFTDNELTVLAHDVSQEQQKRLDILLKGKLDATKILKELKAKAIKDYKTQDMDDKKAFQIMMKDVREKLVKKIKLFK